MYRDRTDLVALMYVYLICTGLDEVRKLIASALRPFVTRFTRCFTLIRHPDSTRLNHWALVLSSTLVKLDMIV
jgi:hypothetical protein